MLSSCKKLAGFTLIELLIVIGIVLLVSVVVVIVINPLQLYRQARDAARLADLNTLNRALNFFEFDQVNGSFGNASTTYFSLIDAAATTTAGTDCAGVGLTPPPNWAYHCAASSSFRNTNGSGWLPVDFDDMTARVISILPVDPVNRSSTGQYYTYTKGSWELTASLESDKYLPKAGKDGGDSLLFEIGKNLTLSPFKTSFTFDSFPVVTSKIGQPGWYKNTGAGAVSLGSDSEGNYLRANGFVWYEWQDNIKFNPSALYKLSCRFRQISDPTVGGKGVFCGVAGLASDQVTYINVNGMNQYGSQYYMAAAGANPTAGAGYATYTGYFRGNGTPFAPANNRSNPTPLYSGVAYFRPMFILNYSAGDGVADMQFEITELDV